MGYNKVADIDDEDQGEQSAGIQRWIAEDWEGARPLHEGRKRKQQPAILDSQDKKKAKQEVKQAKEDAKQSVLE